MQQPPVARWALKTGLDLEQPRNVRDSDFLETLAGWRPTTAVVVAFGQIFPKNLLDLPERGCINVHASLLPRYRGAAPIQAAIIAGDQISGVTTMLMDEGLDTGPILLQRELAIGSNETAGHLSERLSVAGAQVLIETLEGWEAGLVRPRAQPNEGASVAPRLRRRDGIIDWSVRSESLFNLLRGLTPWPGVSTVFRGQSLKILWGRPLAGMEGTAGEAGGLWRQHRIRSGASSVGGSQAGGGEGLRPRPETRGWRTLRLSPRAPGVRSAAARVVESTLRSRRPVDVILRSAETGLEPRDRRLLRELVLGTLRWLRRLDCVIDAASTRRLRDIDARLLTPLRMAVYQLLFLDRIPAHAAVDEGVNEARRRTHRGGAGFVNAVLRRVARDPRLEAWPVTEEDPMRRLAVETSHPDLLVGRWIRFFGEERTRGLLDANNRVKPLQILTFREKGGCETTAAALSAAGVVTHPSQVSPLGLVVDQGDPVGTPCFSEGRIYLQDVASQAAALVPPPGVGERVLDVAAAPGGKSFSLLAYEAEMKLVAADRRWSRLQILRANRDRLGLDIGLLLADGLRPSLRPLFDRVVLDLPCTGTGTLRKNPELKWRVSEEEIRRLSRQGSEMLRTAAALVRPGGILAALTCSLEPEENADVVSRFLAGNRDFSPVPLASELPSPLDSWVTGPGSWQILPEDVHDGFTVHALRRR